MMPQRKETTNRNLLKLIMCMTSFSEQRRLDYVSFLKLVYIAIVCVRIATSIFYVTLNLFLNTESTLLNYIKVVSLLATNKFLI